MIIAAVISLTTCRRIRIVRIQSMNRSTISTGSTGMVRHTGTLSNNHDGINDIPINNHNNNMIDTRCSRKQHPIRGTMLQQPQPQPQQQPPQSRIRVRQELSLQINQYAEMERSFSRNDIEQFTLLIGDSNPIHQQLPPSLPQQHHHNNVDPTTNEQFILDTNENSRHPTTVHTAVDVMVVPGLLVGSIFSAIIGTLIPYSIYVSQSYHFQQPVLVNNVITGHIRILKLRQVGGNNNNNSTGSIGNNNSHNNEGKNGSGIYMICETLVYSRHKTTATTTAMTNDDTHNNNNNDHNESSLASAAATTTTTKRTHANEAKDSSIHVQPLNVDEEMYPDTNNNNNTIIKTPNTHHHHHHHHHQNDRNHWNVLIRGQASVWIPNATLLRYPYDSPDQG